MHVIEITASIPTKFCTVIKSKKCNSRWSKQAHNKSKMADNHHIGKIENHHYLSNGLTDRHEIWRGDAV